MNLFYFPVWKDVHLREFLKTVSWGWKICVQFNHFNTELSLDNVILPWLKYWFHSKFYIHVNIYEKESCKETIIHIYIYVFVYVCVCMYVCMYFSSYKRWKDHDMDYLKKAAINLRMNKRTNYLGRSSCLIVFRCKREFSSSSNLKISTVFLNSGWFTTKR